MMHILYLPIIIFICAFFVRVGSLTSEECLDKGFEVATLKCSTCATLMSVLGESETTSEVLFSECMECCFKDEQQLFERALFQADRRFVKAQKGMLDVLNRLRREYGPAISVKHRSGVHPVLRLFRKVDDEEAAITERVEGWEAQLIEEYVSEHLKQPAVTEEAVDKSVD